MSVSQDKVDECVAILESYQKAEKDLKFYQEKCEGLSSVQKEVKLLTETNEEHMIKISEYAIELEQLKEVNNVNFLKLKHLGRLEQSKIELEIAVSDGK